MNIIWTILTVAALVVLTIQNPEQVIAVCVDSGQRALKTSLGLCGVYCLWMGIFQIAEDCRLVEKLAKVLEPLNKFLYGNVSEVAMKYVALNFSSNLLGVGNAATPSAIAALHETEQDEKLSPFGTMLFVVNATGVQLVPTTVIGIRASMGSAHPSSVLLPNLLCTLATTVLGVVLVRCLVGRQPKSSRRARLNSGRAVGGCSR